jgi:hypothetical protein
MAHVLHRGMKNRESLRKTADGYGVSRETIHRVIHATHRHYEAYFSMDDPSAMPLRGREENGTLRIIRKSGSSMRRTEGSS